MQASNSVASYDGGGEYTPNIKSSGSYWGKTNRSKQDIIQGRYVYGKRYIGT